MNSKSLEEICNHFLFNSIKRIESEVNFFVDKKNFLVFYCS